MKYFLRAVKYYLYMVVILVAVVSALVLLGFTGGSVKEMFVNGYDSLWQMAFMMAAFAAIYPKYGFGKRQLVLPGDPEEIKKGVAEYMKERGYVLKSEREDSMLWRKASPLTRLARFGEDGITFTRNLEGYRIEGLTREIVRIDTGLTHLLGEKIEE